MGIVSPGESATVTTRIAEINADYLIRFCKDTTLADRLLVVAKVVLPDLAASSEGMTKE
jgi:hypothetical protein